MKFDEKEEREMEQIVDFFKRYGLPLSLDVAKNVHLRWRTSVRGLLTGIHARQSLSDGRRAEFLWAHIGNLGNSFGLFLTFHI